jgi:RHS repeat-associated protein
MITTSQLSENSHQGFEGLKAALCLGSTAVKSNTASEMPLRLRQNRIGSRSSGKERDNETGLDFFGARYLSAAEGRFTSPDPLLNSGRPSVPQSWNRYAYTLNNPLRFIDPTGLYDLDNNCDEDDKKCNKEFANNAKQLKKALEKINKKLAKAKLGSDEQQRLSEGLSTLGTEDDGNGVLVTFGALSGIAAARTDVTDNGNGGVNFEITFDPSRNKGDMWAVNGAHEGTHVSDMGEPEFNAGELSDFQLEYRGYMTSSAAAHAFGVGSLTMIKKDGTTHQIWNSSWLSADKATLTSKGQVARDKGITDQVMDKDHPDTNPQHHDPW